MFTTREFELKAQQCREIARTSQLPTTRSAWTKLAERWDRWAAERRSADTMALARAARTSRRPSTRARQAPYGLTRFDYR